MNEDTIGLIFLLVILLISGIIFLIPTIVAFKRGHRNKIPIMFVNILFGGTGLGWGIALIWAFMSETTIKLEQ